MDVVASESEVRAGPHIIERADPEQAALFAPLRRVAEASQVVLLGAGTGHRAQVLREAHGGPIIVYEPHDELAEYALEMYRERFDGCAFVRTLNELRTVLQKESLLNRHRVLFLCPKPYRRAFPEAFDEAGKTIHEVETMRRVRKNTISNRFQHIIESGLRNLDALRQHPMWTQMGRPLEGRPAFVVAAGPSLDVNGHLLAEAAKRGAVFVVGTSGPVVRERYGVEPDCLVSIEALDVSDKIARSGARFEALDLTSNANNLAATEAPKCMFTPDSDPWQELNQRLGSRPLGYGASVATAAWHLAILWGADPVVMLGQDCAWTGGRGWATGTGRGGWPVTWKAPKVRIHYPDEYLETFRAGGVTPPQQEHPGFLVEAWGGKGEVPTTHDLHLFRRYFEGKRSEYPDVRCINATEGGARFEGFEEARLEELLAELPERERVKWPTATPAAGELDKWVWWAKKSTKRLQKATKRILSSRSYAEWQRAEREWQKAREACVVGTAHAGPRVMQNIDKFKGDPELEGPANMKAFTESTARVLELLR